MNDFAYEIVTGTPLTEIGTDFFTGNMNGLLVTVEHIPTRGLIEIRFGATRLSDDEMSRVCQAFREYIDSKKSYLQIDEYSICILLYTDVNWKLRFHRILEIIDTLGFKMNIDSGCYLCGETGDDIRPYEIESLRAFLCPSCAKRTTDDLCETLQEKTANTRFTRFASSDISEPELYIPGSLAALVGAMAGLVLLFLLAQISFGCLFAGIGMALLIFIPYRKFAQTVKVRGLLISIGMLFLFLFIGLAIISTPQIVRGINTFAGENAVTNGSVFFSYLYYARDPGVSKEVYSNILYANIGAIGTTLWFFISNVRKNNT